MKYLALALAVLCATQTVRSQNVYTPCSDGSPVPENVVITVGDVVCTKAPCNLVRGQTAKCSIDFISPEYSVTTVVQKIKATTSGITTNFPIPDADKGCDKLTTTTCPLDSREPASIVLGFDVLELYPKVALELTIILQDQNSKTFSCFEMTGKVVDS